MLSRLECDRSICETFISHLFSSSGEINPFDLSMIGEDLVEILSRGVTQFTGELQQAASLIIQGFLGKQKSRVLLTRSHRRTCFLRFRMETHQLFFFSLFLIALLFTGMHIYQL